MAALALSGCGDPDEAEDFDPDQSTAPASEDEETDEADETDEAAPGDQQISWATSDVGSAGYAALVNLAAMLNREWDGFAIDVLPTAGAVQSVIGYATGEFDGYYGADIGFYEMARGIDRFEEFADQAERTPVQTFWAYPLETGLAIHQRDADKYTSWADLSGEAVFTGPAPWDVRANLERAMNEIGVGHEYVELDVGVAGSSLDGGEISGLIAYTTAQAAPPPWFVESELQTDMQVLNPSEDEIAQLQAAGMTVVEVDTSAFETGLGADTAMFVPFYYGFHVGTEVSEDDVYNMLDVINDNLEDLVATNPSFSILAEDMAEFQRRGVESAIDDAEVHPGLARWMQDHDVWDSSWDGRIASAS
jgi:hypothetical protein